MSKKLYYTGSSILQDYIICIGISNNSKTLNVTDFKNYIEIMIIPNSFIQLSSCNNSDFSSRRPSISLEAKDIQESKFFKVYYYFQA